MSTTTKLNFPDIKKVIYEERESLSGIREKYIEILRKSDALHNHLYANKLEESAQMLTQANLKQLEHEFYDFKEHMRQSKINCHMTIKYRQKDFIRFNDKIRYCLINGLSLDKIRDLIGFRITLQTSFKDTEETVIQCYQLLNHIIDFFVVSRQCIPLQAEPRINSDFNQSKHPDIIVPEKSLVTEGFESYIKDYILFPKENGYQSLHIVLKNLSGLTFEVQIRTTAMDIVAENGNAAHDSYKKNRKKNSDICLDYSKINIPGFYYFNEQIYDSIGLVKSIDPFNTL